MPVLVTAAHRPVARRLVRRLLAEGGEVRAFTDGDAAELRAAGAFVASGTPDDEGRLEAAMADVHTVVHLGDALLAPDPRDVVEAARTTAQAASNAGVRRLIVTTLPGATATAADPLRRALHQVEVLAAGAGPPSIVLRPSLVDTAGVRDALATVGLTSAERDLEVAPVREADLLELVVAFDRARSRATSGHLVVAADGPSRMTIAEYLERVGVPRPGHGGLLGRRVRTEAELPLLRPALTGPWWSEDDRILDGWTFAGLRPVAPGPGSRP